MRRAVIVLLSITAAFGADKKGFAVKEASSYPGHQTQEGVTMAAVPYNTAELAESAFGKVRPHEYGILPVLVVIRNNTDKPLRLNPRAEFVTAERENLEAIPPQDVVRFQGTRAVGGASRPKIPLPIPVGKSNKKGPLNAPEIDGRAFAVKLLPPGEAAHGFFYFQADSVRGAMLFFTGIENAATGQAFFYFEIPLDEK